MLHNMHRSISYVVSDFYFVFPMSTLHSTEELYVIKNEDIGSMVTWKGQNKQRNKMSTLNVDELQDIAYGIKKVGRPKKKVIAVKIEPEIDTTHYLSRRVAYFKDAKGLSLQTEYITPKIAAENHHLIDNGFICPQCCRFAGVKDESGALHYLPNHSKGRLQKRPECKNKLFSQRVQKEVRVVMVVR